MMPRRFAPVVLFAKAASRHVGAEADVVGSYQFSKVWSGGMGVGRVFAGAYLKQSTKGADYTYPYITWSGRF